MNQTKSKSEKFNKVINFVGKLKFFVVDLLNSNNKNNRLIFFFQTFYFESKNGQLFLYFNFFFLISIACQIRFFYLYLIYVIINKHIIKFLQ